MILLLKVAILTLQLNPCLRRAEQVRQLLTSVHKVCVEALSWLLKLQTIGLAITVRATDQVQSLSCDWWTMKAAPLTP